MKSIVKVFAAVGFAIIGFGITSASAEHRSSRPAICEVDHDHRSHASNYYNYYKKDRYFRADPYYRRGGISVSIRLGDRNDRYDRHDRRDRRYDRRDRRDRYDRYDRYDRRRNNGYNNRDGRVVNRQVFDTRYRARIVVKERIEYRRRGRERLVCTVRARGPEAELVSYRRMKRIANRECSQRARIYIDA